MQGLLGVPTNFPQGWASGVNVRGMQVLNSYPGQVLWLSNSTTNLGPCVAGKDGNPGTWQKPFATLQAASTAATANVGTVIATKPGHSETISSATALTLATAGVQVIGMGYGSARPLFTLDTAATATINVTANNCGFSNCQFVANFANITSLFTLTTAKGFSVDNCTIKDTSASLNFLVIVTTDTTSNNADQLSLTNNRVNLLTAAGAALLVSPLGTNDEWTIAGNNYRAVTTGTGAVIPIATGKILTNFALMNNWFSLVQTTGVTTGILITTNGSTNSGWLDGNRIQALDATTPILVTASSGFLFGDNLYQPVADKSGLILPATS